MTRDSSRKLQIRIVPHGEVYAPYYHTVYYARIHLIIKFYKPKTEIVTYQSGRLCWRLHQIEYQAGTAELPINFEWYTDGSAEGDYKVFVHVLDGNDQIVAQADTYPGNGTLPPGNWLPGVLHDRIVVDLGETPPGHYRVAMGLYNPYTLERLQPEGGDGSGQFFIGDVEIQ